MKNISRLLSLLFVTGMLFALNSCSEDNPVIERSWEEGPTENGTLEVFVKIGISTDYCAGAIVKLFKTKEDMDADNYFMMSVTDPQDPRPGSGHGALFKDVPFAQYWVQARWTTTGGAVLIGADQTWVPKGKASVLTIPVSQ